ncbi:MAG TPA: 2,3-bisphosphoglycerate-independent phosphoglycerate mutase [Solirubrobacterales bacterium]|nr:2,3-bisphosphoglycerate-independent phosphoglycerate mutase [Solirubrobacterales bacterium]
MAELPSGPDSIPVPGLALIVLDGWGLAEPGPGNAIERASTPTFDALWREYPHTTLSASGHDVGLPDGQMGNSEVGHLNLGAGSIVRQDLARIDAAVADGSFFEIAALTDACRRAVESPRGRLHLVGLVSDGGVHSGWEHIEACVELAAREGVPDLVLHAFTDGRDTSPSGGARYIEEAERWLRSAGRIGTVGGRYYGMDRDHRWERTKRAYDAIVHGAGPRAEGAGGAVADAYAAGDTDEFIKPTVIGGYDGAQPGDVVIAFNFRPDRMRQIIAALGDPGFDGFERGGDPGLDVTTMASYRAGWPYPVAFPPSAPETTMAEVISAAGARQIHVAETEKYAHVTYFFNGGREAEWSGEERRMADSPRDVPTYDHKPEMSAAAAADAFCSAWEGGEYRFGIINFANPDMVGHTGSIPAAVAAVEAVDGCLARVVGAVHGAGGACIVTADHGNAEQMLEPDGSPNTAHSTNLVPLIATVHGIRLRAGILADVSPTALDLLGIEQPAGMTGRSLRG